MTKDHCRHTSYSQDASNLLQLVQINSRFQVEKQSKEKEDPEEEVYTSLLPHQKINNATYVPVLR